MMMYSNKSDDDVFKQIYTTVTCDEKKNGYWLGDISRLSFLSFCILLYLFLTSK